MQRDKAPNIERHICCVQSPNKDAGEISGDGAFQGPFLKTFQYLHVPRTRLFKMETIIYCQFDLQLLRQF